MSAESRRYLPLDINWQLCQIEKRVDGACDKSVLALGQSSHLLDARIGETERTGAAHMMCPFVDRLHPVRTAQDHKLGSDLPQSAVLDDMLTQRSPCPQQSWMMRHRSIDIQCTCKATLEILNLFRPLIVIERQARRCLDHCFAH